MDKNVIIDKNTIAYRLDYAMRLRGMRNTDVCERSRMLGFPMGSSTISQYISGKYEPKHDKLLLLSRILGVPQLWLMGVTPFEDIEGYTQNFYANPMETELLTLFRQHNNAGKEFLIRIAQTTLNMKEYTL